MKIILPKPSTFKLSGKGDMDVNRDSPILYRGTQGTLLIGMFN